MMFIVKYYLKNKSFPKEFARNKNKELNLTTQEALNKILSIFENVKKTNINIETSKPEDLKKKLKINEEDFELIYLIKNSLNNKKRIIPENIKEKSNKNLMETSKKILNEIKRGNGKLILKYENQEKLRALYNENIKKSCRTHLKSQITGSPKGQLHKVLI